MLTQVNRVVDADETCVENNDADDAVDNKKKMCNFNRERKLDSRSFFAESNCLIDFLSQKKYFSKLDLYKLNRKRVTQMFDLFNSKYDCRKCRKKLRYKAEQIIHEKLKHNKQLRIGQKINKIKCPYCKQVFGSYFQLRNHVMIVHLDERPYGCKVCNKKFHAFISLKRHCIKKHLNTSSSESTYSSSLSSSSSTSSSDSASNDYFKQTNTDLVDLIDYENSLIKTTKIKNFLPSYNETNLSINSFKNQKFFHFLNSNTKPINIEPLIDYIEFKKVENLKKSILKKNQFNEPALRVELNDQNFDHCKNDQNFDHTKNNQAKHTQETFTILTQLNVAKCNLCMRFFKTNSDYLIHYWQTHLTTAQSGNDFFCWSCADKNTNNPDCSDEFLFKNELDLLNHLQLKHLKELSFKCSQCKNGNFASLNEVKLHYTNTHCKQSTNLIKFLYSCLCCEQVFQNFDSAQKHFEQNFQCNLNNFQSPIKLCCIYCKETFLNEATFKIHLSQHKIFYLNNQNQAKIVSKKTPIFTKKTNMVNNSLKLSSTLNQTPTTSNQNKQSKNSLKYSIESIVGSHCNLNRKLESSSDPTNLPIDYSTKASLNTQISNDHKTTSNSSRLATSLLPGSILSNTTSDQSFIIPFNNPQQQLNKNMKFFENFNFWQNFQQSSDSLQQQQQTNLNSDLLNKFNNLQTFLQNNFKFPSPSIFMLPNLLNNNESEQIQKLQTKVLSTNSSVSNQVLNGVAKCDLCGYTFRTMVELNQHRASHSGSNSKRPFKCHLCQVTFAKSDQLIRHMIVHQASEMDSVCQICFSSFSRKQDLDRHMLFHSK